MSTTFEQTVDVTGYKGYGLTALLTFYVRAGSGGTESETITASIEAFDADDSSISSTTGAAISSTSALWKRSTLTWTLPELTAKLKIKFSFGGATVPVIKLAYPRLQIGQVTGELLTNGNFDSAFTTGWTAVSGFGFQNDTANDYATLAATSRSIQPAGGTGVTGVSEIRQDASIPTGFVDGTAELRFAAAQILTGIIVGEGGFYDGEVILEARDAGGVLASVTTGAQPFAYPWEAQLLRLDIPAGATTLRVRVRGYADLVASPDEWQEGGPHFDDFSLRVHKYLDASFERVLDFNEPSRCELPTVWQQFYIAHPTMDYPAIWNGADVLPTIPPSLYDATATAAWSDGSFPESVKIPGHWTIDSVPAASASAYRFVRALAGVAVDVQVTSEAVSYGAFTKATDFSVAVCFRVTEDSMTLACGLVGRRSVTGVGWGITINTSGQLVATVQGTSAKTVTGTRDVRDKATHWVLMTWQASTETLKIYDGAGVSTLASAAPGEFASAGEVTRIGRDAVGSATGGVDIARVLIWDTVIDTTVFASEVDVIGTDPNGQIDRATGWTSDREVYVDGNDDDTGATLVRCAKYHIPIGYSSALDNGDGVSGWGVSIGYAHTNLVVNTNYSTGVSCGPTAGASVVVTDAIDPTGLPKGVRVQIDSVGAGYRLTDMPLGLTAGEVTIVFYARASENTFSITGSFGCELKLFNSSEVEVASDVFTAGEKWTRCAFTFSWDGSTPTAHFAFLTETDSDRQLELSHVVWVGFAATGGAARGGAATAYQAPSVAVSDRHGVVVESLPLQLHREGEIVMEGIAPSITHGATIASVDNNTTDQKNQRAIQSQNSANDLLAIIHNDSGTPTSIGTPYTWTSQGRAGTRWNLAALPETGSDKLGARVDDSTPASTSPASFTVSASVPSIRIRLGGGSPNGSTSPHALLSKIVVRAREEKFP